MELLNQQMSFAGVQRQYKHQSSCLDCDMVFSVYLPPQAQHDVVPVVFWLSGLTCTDENFVTKAGAQRIAAELGLAIVCPDTSPRGEQVPDDPSAAYDFGLGAGFYLNATQAPFDKHYKMYDYVVHELPRLLVELPLDLSRASIMGHSMGGHGALTIAIKNPDQYRSVSAFSPICAPSQCPWGHKALAGYLGVDQKAWEEYDATALLLERGCRLPIKIDQGEADNFLVEQLKPELFLAAAKVELVDVEYGLHPGYDHSYFFIASFIEEHLRFHHRYLG
ncbi:S-formylglutathione hydrolase [Pseudoteredinibacter isoporae]|uniref:S-formylglutathione hydrolase n=1 Tax=Pseudoteredinibacter isoporae TaxID=570281 RepID=A0A7X0JT33_9GAMM|nr:S-formylglutathione hydrolase [Pseudoteredinibacter isoporae]MBB6521354.1 S-formylglutathione hydrolase [Pseudoteredinibacter isoporae]NHO86909.1 S-formylglutathione hydrolase [Pseudoteredinibacter isoporae]NIB24639.1 S-formylglutathione hydrolase [Pseudoteredinibacter isoporae]